MAGTETGQVHADGEGSRLLRLFFRSWATCLLLLGSLATLALALWMRPPLVVAMGQKEATPLLRGFYEPERLGERSFRWSGENATIRFLDPGLPAPLVLVLRAAAVRPEGVPVTITAGSAPVGTILVRQDPAVYQVVLPVSARAASGTIPIGLTASPFRAPNDPRPLGVLVESAELRSRFQSLPAFPVRSCLVLLAFVLALYAAFLRLTMRPCLAALLAAPAVALEGVYAWRHWMIMLASLSSLAGLAAGVVALIFLFAADLRADGPRLARSLAHGRPRAVPGPADRAPAGLVWTLRLLALAVLALHLLARYLPVERGPYESYSWGVRFFARLPQPWQWLSVGMAIAACLGSGWLARALVWLARRLPRLRRFNRYVGITLLAGLAVALFWLLRTRCYSGDWAEVLEDISRGEIWRERSPLDFLLRSVIGRPLAARWPGWLGLPPPMVRCLTQPAAAADSFGALRPAQAAISCLAGGLFVAAAASLDRALFRLRPDRWLFILLLAGQGTAVFFAGHIEMYTLVTASMMVYLAVAALALQRRIGLVWPMLAFLLASATHLQALYLGPSLLVLVFLRFSQEGREWPGWVGGLLKLALTGLLLLYMLAMAFLLLGYDPVWLQKAAGGMGGVDGVFLKHLVRPDPAAHEPYPILSWTHLRAMANQQLLVAPLSLLAGAAVSIFIARRLGGRDRLLWFLLSAMLPALLFTVVYNPDLGAAQDWDLLAPPGLLVTVTAAYLLLSRVRPAGVRLAAAIPWLAVSLLHTAGWLVANRLGL